MLFILVQLTPPLFVRQSLCPIGRSEDSVSERVVEMRISGLLLSELGITREASHMALADFNETCARW